MNAKNTCKYLFNDFKQRKITNIMIRNHNAANILIFVLILGFVRCHKFTKLKHLI